MEPRRAKPSMRKETPSVIGKKMKPDESQLSIDENLNRQQVAEMRMHNKAQQRFIIKYPQLNIYESISEASNDVLHEMPNPSVSDHQHAEFEPTKPTYIKSSSVNMQDLHVLLFTNGEIDIDKVLCLYLLTAHKTETLRIPPKSHRVCYKARTHLPLERLIERSRTRNVRPTIFQNLPIFILDVPVLPPKKGPRRDPRLAGKVIINTKILQMIHSVKIALEVANPQLLRHFVYLAHDRSRIENTMMQPKMEAFYRTLYGQNIISSCESFHLEALPRNCLTFRVDVEPLEEMVRLLRNNVLYVPNSTTWRKCVYSKGIAAFDDKFDSESCVCSASGLRDGDIQYDITAELKRMHIINPDTDDLPTTSRLSNDDCSDDELDEACMMQMHQPKIMKNLDFGFSDIHIGAEEPEEAPLDPNMPIEKLVLLLDQKVKEVSTQDYQNFLEGIMPSTSDSEESIVEEIQTPVVPQYSFNAKQISCLACLKRYQDPLPTPKISNIKKIPLPQVGEASYFFSKSAQRISDLLNEKLRKVEQEEQRAKRINTDKVRMQRPNEDQTIEIIDLKEIDLAKIRLEIKETETAKKMKKFFGNK